MVRVKFSLKFIVENFAAQLTSYIFTVFYQKKCEELLAKKLRLQVCNLILNSFSVKNEI